MKITDIKIYPVLAGRRHLLIVKIETDEGVFGWGESGMSSRELAVLGALKHYREWLIGKDPMRMGALWQEMYRSQYFEGGRALTAAISAIDIALHDLVGKALNVPVYQLLGGRHRDYVPCFATTSTGTEERLIEQVRLLIEQGWTCIRTGGASTRRPGETPDPNLFEPWESVPATARMLTRVREAIGSEVILGIDYHHRLSVAETASFCQRMPTGTLDFLEEPIRDETPEAYEALRGMVDVPFAIGEEFASKWQFLPYIERGIANYARVDVCNVGGLTEAKKVASWAEAHYIDLMPHNPLGPICTAATIHLAAAVPNFSWLEARDTPTESLNAGNEDMFPVQPKLEGSRYPVLATPGLGIEVNEELAARQVFEFTEMPHLYRRDGSHTNW